MTMHKSTVATEAPKKAEILINSSDVDAEALLAQKLHKLILKLKKDYSEIVVLCVGTDRCTGDSLAPLVGTLLTEGGQLAGKCTIVGTLDNPVHARNLEDTLATIDTATTLVIAIDACLGSFERVGSIELSDKALKPGAGVGRELPHVGDISIKGIVNMSGAFEMMVLQNTRLSVVYNMAKVIEASVACAISVLVELAQEAM
jgi:putative sporulation protein YyaC